MSFEEILKNYTPVVNEDKDGREILKGTYRCALDLKVGETKSEPKQDAYKMELDVVDILEGNGSAGRRFFRTYLKDDDKSVTKMLNDLFTAGISLPTGSVEDFEIGLDLVQGNPVTVRAWGWTPDKDRSGNIIAEDKREAQQMFKIVSASGVKVKERSASEVPF